jgi:hypothetical protein
VSTLHIVLAVFAALIRILRPSRGLHAAPRAIRREVREEARAARVRRYANPLPARPTGPGHAFALPSPRQPLDDAPRGTPVPAPADYVPGIDTDAVAEPADIVRGYYRAHEVRTKRLRTDRTRLGVAVLREIAAARAEVPA